MAARIAAHRAERPAGLADRRGAVRAGEAHPRCRPAHTVLVDCLSLWVANALGRGDEPDTRPRLRLREPPRRRRAFRGDHRGVERGRPRHRAGDPARARLPRSARLRQPRLGGRSPPRRSLVVAGRALALATRRRSRTGCSHPSGGDTRVVWTIDAGRCRGRGARPASSSTQDEAARQPRPPGRRSRCSLAADRGDASSRRRCGRRSSSRRPITASRPKG